MNFGDVPFEARDVGTATFCEWRGLMQGGRMTDVLNSWKLPPLLEYEPRRAIWQFCTFVSPHSNAYSFTSNCVLCNCVYWHQIAFL